MRILDSNPETVDRGNANGCKSAKFSEIIELSWKLIFSSFVAAITAVAPQRPLVRGTTGARSDGTTTIIRLTGLGYVTYSFAKLPNEFIRQVDEEEITFWFLTDQEDGLVWLQDDPGRVMYMSMKVKVKDRRPYFG